MEYTFSEFIQSMIKELKILLALKKKNATKQIIKKKNTITDAESGLWVLDYMQWVVRLAVHTWVLTWVGFTGRSHGFSLPRTTAQLPDNFQLASDPDKDIWCYYKILSCTTLFDVKSVVVVVDVPLLDRERSYVVHSILNFLLPQAAYTGSADGAGLLAKFKLRGNVCNIVHE